MKPHHKIIFALDVPTRREADKYIEMLHEHVGLFKVGLELFLAEGPTAVYDFVHNSEVGVMLDLKPHDIPETVERAVLRAGDLGVKFVTLHVQQRETMRRAAAAAAKTGIQLLGVTVLTSMTERDCQDLILLDDIHDVSFNPSTRAVSLAKLAWEEGINGFVCSPKEITSLRTLPGGPILVVPGIRPAGSEAGDQRRTGTPAQAIKDGADFLVVGRPIRDAKDPVAAAKAIAAEISQAC